MTAEVRAATERAGRTLDQFGAVVEEVDVTVERALVRQASNAHNGVLFAASLAGDVKGREDRVNRYVLAWLDEVLGEVTPTSTFEGRVVESLVAQRVDRVLVDHDVLVCPVMAMPAFEAGVDHTLVPFVLDGVERETFHDLHLAEVFNICSRSAQLVVAVGRSTSGVPIGLHVTGRTYCDASVMQVGAALEAASPRDPVAPLPPAAAAG